MDKIKEFFLHMSKQTKMILLAVLLLSVLGLAGGGYMLLKDFTPAMGSTSSQSSTENKSSLSSSADSSQSSSEPSSEPSSTVSQSTPEPEPAPPQWGNSPVFTVTDGSGTPVDIRSLAGKPIVLNFWATWCGYCVAEMGDFQNVYNKYNGQVAFVFLSTEPLSLTQEFMKQGKYTLPPYQSDGSAESLYGIRGFPTTVILDKDGNIYWTQVGTTNQQAVESVLSKLLN